MVWRAHADQATGLLDGREAPLRSKVLSRNANTNAASVLCDLPAGWSSRLGAVSHERFLVNTTGRANRRDRAGAVLTPAHRPRGLGLTLATRDGTELLVKVGEPA